MKDIEIRVLNPEAIIDAENMAVAAARLTQRGHAIQNMETFMEVYKRPYTSSFLHTLATLPHPTLQMFGTINVAVVGASRRFLAQITRHQVGVKFMSSSLQYSDYSNAAQFVVPYEIIKLDKERQGNAQYVENYHTTQYLNSCLAALRDYERSIEHINVPHDAAAYMMPQGLRGVLIISATPYAWKHMISQRVCKRNSLETQYIMLRIWEDLSSLSTLFQDCAPFCLQDGCKEGKMSCGKPFTDCYPKEILDTEFEYIR